MPSPLPGGALSVSGGVCPPSGRIKAIALDRRAQTPVPATLCYCLADYICPRTRIDVTQLPKYRPRLSPLHWIRLYSPEVWSRNAQVLCNEVS